MEQTLTETFFADKQELMYEIQKIFQSSTGMNVASAFLFDFGKIQNQYSDNWAAREVKVISSLDGAMNRTIKDHGSVLYSDKLIYITGLKEDEPSRAKSLIWDSGVEIAKVLTGKADVNAIASIYALEIDDDYDIKINPIEQDDLAIGQAALRRKKKRDENYRGADESGSTLKCKFVPAFEANGNIMFAYTITFDESDFQFQNDYCSFEDQKEMQYSLQSIIMGKVRQFWNDLIDPDEKMRIIVPIVYEMTFLHPFNRLLRPELSKWPSDLRRSAFFEVVNVPESTTINRLIDAVNLIRPFCRGFFIATTKRELIIRLQDTNFIGPSIRDAVLTRQNVQVELNHVVKLARASGRKVLAHRLLDSSNSSIDVRKYGDFIVDEELVEPLSALAQSDVKWKMFRRTELIGTNEDPAALSGASKSSVTIIKDVGDIVPGISGILDQYLSGKRNSDEIARYQPVVSVAGKSLTDLSILYHEIGIGVGHIVHELNVDNSVDMGNIIPLFGASFDALNRVFVVKKQRNASRGGSDPIGINIALNNYRDDGRRAEFSEFYKNASSRMFVEIDLRDVVGFPRIYAQFREFAKRQKMQTVIDGIDIDHLRMLNVSVLASDFFKIRFSSRLLQNSTYINLLTNFVRQVTPQRVIFTWIEDQKSVVLCQSIGVKLMQGWHVDKMAQSANLVNTG